MDHRLRLDREHLAGRAHERGEREGVGADVRADVDDLVPGDDQLGEERELELRPLSVLGERDPDRIVVPEVREPAVSRVRRAETV